MFLRFFNSKRLPRRAESLAGELLLRQRLVWLFRFQQKPSGKTSNKEKEINRNNDWKHRGCEIRGGGRHWREASARSDSRRILSHIAAFLPRFFLFAFSPYTKSKGSTTFGQGANAITADADNSLWPSQSRKRRPQTKLTPKKKATDSSTAQSPAKTLPIRLYRYRRG